MAAGRHEQEKIGGGGASRMLPPAEAAEAESAASAEAEAAALAAAQAAGSAAAAPVAAAANSAALPAGLPQVCAALPPRPHWPRLIGSSTVCYPWLY